MADKSLERKIAEERTLILTNLASRALRSGEPAIARRYVKLANEIIAHYRLGHTYRGKILCRSCGFLLEPGLTCDVRMASSKRKMVYRCRICGNETKLHY